MTLGIGPGSRNLFVHVRYYLDPDSGQPPDGVTGRTMRKPRFPEGWDEDRVRRVLAHYEGQTEEEAVAEDDAAYDDRTQSFIEVPVELVPAVRRLIATHGR